MLDMLVLRPNTNSRERSNEISFSMKFFACPMLVAMGGVHLYVTFKLYADQETVDSCAFYQI